MEAVAFDTLKYSERMVDAGFDKKQAKAMAEEQFALINAHMATKRDIKELEAATKTATLPRSSVTLPRSSATSR